MWLERCGFYWMSSALLRPVRAESALISDHTLANPVTSTYFFPLQQNAPVDVFRPWAGHTLRFSNSSLFLRSRIYCHLTEWMPPVWPPVYECLISHDRFIDFWQVIQLGPLDWGPGYSSAWVVWGLWLLVCNQIQRFVLIPSIMGQNSTVAPSPCLLHLC